MSDITGEKKSFWFALDNAAKIFPGQNSKTWSNSFRVCYELNEKIDPELLQQALLEVIPRFPCYNVRIRHGFFWFYLETNKNKPVVMQDIKNPCYRVKFNENGRFLFKVYYHGSRIAIDCYHVLTDGCGGKIFLSTLVARYLELKHGIVIPPGQSVLDIHSSCSAAELEDSFVKYADSKAKLSRRDKFVYHANGTKMPYHTVNVTSGIILFDDFHKLTKAYGVTVTEFLAALMLQVLIEKQNTDSKKRRKREVSIQIPVDLRRTFNSQTLRNFTICMRVKVDPNKGDYSFDELLTQVKYQLRLANDPKEHNMMITANMGIERNPIVRALPLFIKNAGVSISFFFTAEQTTSSLITNLGSVDIPKEMLPYVNKFIFMPAPGKLNAARCGVATCNNNLVITFSNSFAESDIERSFFVRLVKMGLHVKIESNRE